MKYFLAVDQGTSSSRVFIFNSEGTIVDSRQFELTQYYPQSGWVEHCPEQIWRNVLSGVQELVQLYSNDILACGITNQRETVLAWDKETNRCLGRAIVWQDRRTSQVCKDLRAHTQKVKEKTGLLLDPYFSATKMQWILANYPEAKTLLKNNRLAIGTIDSFLIWRLTGGKKFVTDMTNASRTSLFNINQLKWDQELLDLFQVPYRVLPAVKNCCDDFGVIASQWMPFKSSLSIPITGVAGDQQAAVIGQACFNPGSLKSTYGTGCFLLLNTGKKRVESKTRLLTTIAYAFNGEATYCLEGSIFNAGTTVKWLRDELQLIDSAAETETLAASLDDNGGVYMVPAFTGLGAPYWESNVRAMILGMERSTNKAHLARAVLESVVYQTKDVLKCMEQDSDIKADILRVDGGMVVNNWFLQFLADSCQTRIQRPRQVETTAVGAALLAAVGCGYCSGISELSQSFWSLDQQFVPMMSEASSQYYYDGWLSAVERARMPS